MRLRGDGGFSAPIMTLLLALMILGAAGISVDLWRVISEHREVAGLVDGAAAAGATAIDENALYVDPNDVRLDVALAEDRVCDYLATRAGISRSSCPGPVVDVVVTSQTVGVSLERDVELSLLRLLLLTGDGAAPITVGSSSTVVVVRGLP